MSARPDLARLSDEELDVLLSRSLDGDLSSEEERELSAFLASDARAARRREELAELVGRLNALPAPAAPLGMTARVNAHTADHARGFGAIWHRLGLFPPPAMVRGIAALFVIVVGGALAVFAMADNRRKKALAGVDITLKAKLRNSTLLFQYALALINEALLLLLLPAILREALLLPPLAFKLLRLVNSASLGLSQRIESIIESIEFVRAELSYPAADPITGLAIPKVTVATVRRMKYSVDQFRLFLWAYLDTWAQGGSDPAVRMQRRSPSSVQRFTSSKNL